MADLDATALVGLLADDNRRRVVAAIELGARHVDAVVAATRLTPHRLPRRWASSSRPGWSCRAPTVLSLVADVFQQAARRANTQAQSTEFDDEPDEARKVLRAFVVNGRLQSIPVAAAKRMVILDWLAQEFEPGHKYSEKMVNLMLGKRHADTAALRRHLVDHGFLDRADGQYWRAGGTVDR